MRTKGYMIAHALKHTQAKDLLGFFCDAVRCGTIVGVEQSEQLLLEWIAGKVERGEPLVPRLARGTRRRLTPDKKAERDLELTRAVAHLANQGSKLDDAYDRVATSSGVGRELVIKAYKKYGRHERLTFACRVYERVHDPEARAADDMIDAEALKHAARYFDVSEDAVKKACRLWAKTKRRAETQTHKKG